MEDEDTQREEEKEGGAGEGGEDCRAGHRLRALIEERVEEGVGQGRREEGGGDVG